MNITQKAFIESFAIILTIAWAPVFAIITSACGACYYIAMLKSNVVNKEYNRSWKQFFKSIFKLKK